MQHQQPITGEEFASLREAMGWPSVSLDAARQCIDEACFVWGARDDGRLVGLVRVIGDGILSFYVSDVMVHEESRGRGVGNELMKRLLDYLRTHAAPGATVAVVPLRGRESFYEEHGFAHAPKEIFGDSMLWLEPLRELLGPS